MNRQQHDFARPIAVFRKRIYLACILLAVASALGPWGGVILGIFTPETAAWIWGLVAYVALLTPLAVAWLDAPGENRSFLEKAYEFMLVWFPVSASSQVSWEFPWLIYDALGLMKGVGPQDHWAWQWWAYGTLADKRYLTGDAGLFGVECLTVPAGFLLMVAFFGLIRAKADVKKRLRAMWQGFFAMSVMVGIPVIYFASEIRDHFIHISTDFWTAAYWFVFMNVWWTIVPAIILPLLVKMIASLYREQAASVVEPGNGVRHGAVIASVGAEGLTAIC
jgi:hypothetical protein